jgi:tRNA threonylcarbamoyladenosine biosynthesis protein TsaE
MKTYTLNLEEISILTKKISESFKNGVIILRGDLASGKTTFVKEMAKYMGVKDEVTSPTFSLQQCYANKVFHYDIYNHGLEHFISLGMLEELEKDGLHFIEWGDDALVKILTSADIPTLTIDIEKQNNNRTYKVNYEHA